MSGAERNGDWNRENTLVCLRSSPLRSAPGFHVRGVNRGGLDNGNQLRSPPLGGRGRTEKDGFSLSF